MGPTMVEHRDFRRGVDDAIALLFGLVTESLGWATLALLDQDPDRANQVIAGDDQIDKRCDELSALVKERLSTTTLDPDELEELVAILQLVPELERSADLAEHIARRTLGGLGGRITPRSRGLIQSMNDAAVRMWQRAGAGYEERSRDVAFDLTEADEELDQLAAELLREGVGDGADAAIAVELALIARFYERSGDHAVNIARRIDSMVGPRRAAHRPSRRRAQQTGAAGDGGRRWRKRLSGLARLRLVPRDEGFFELFEASANNARDCAEELQKLIASFSDLQDHYDRVKAFERRGDQITIDLLRRLDSSFVTPYDREDIHALAEELDDVVDDMFAVAELIQLVKVNQPLPELNELADVLVAMSDDMAVLIGSLRSREGVRHRLERIEHLERQGDVIYRRIMARLFGGEYEALEVLKWKDIVQALENSLNTIEDVSDVVESILVKSS